MGSASSSSRYCSTRACWGLPASGISATTCSAGHSAGLGRGWRTQSWASRPPASERPASGTTPPNRSILEPRIIQRSGAHSLSLTSQVMLVVKNLPVNTGDIRDAGSIPGSGRSPGGGYGNPPQYSCLENPTNRRVWPATVNGVIQSRT